MSVWTIVTIAALVWVVVSLVVAVIVGRIVRARDRREAGRYRDGESVGSSGRRRRR
ncbi:MAG: hypothetical protein QM662_00065 [Gordonia sp. (in: high G+C Gram-positive bacteria)]